MQHATCILCSKPGWPWFEKADKFPPHEAMRVVRCRDCGLAWVSPRPPPNEIARYYPATYSWRSEPSGRPSAIHRAERWYRFHLLRYETRQLLRNTDLAAGDAVLDVGCSSGDRLLVMQEAGLVPTGVEVSPAADYARKQLGLDVHHGALEEASLKDGRFRAVTLYNVLEHVHDPRPLLREARRIIAPGGWLVVQAPNLGSVQARLLEKYWAAVDVPRDLYYWTPALLARLLEKEGFQGARVEHRTSFLHPPTAAISLVPWSDPQLAWQADAGGSALGGLARRIVWAAVTAAVMAPVWLESFAGASAIPTTFARKA